MITTKPVELYLLGKQLAAMEAADTPTLIFTFWDPAICDWTEDAYQTREALRQTAEAEDAVQASYDEQADEDRKAYQFVRDE